MNCSVGFYSAFVENVPTCVQCHPGTYNGQVGQSECTPCPEHMSTLESGLATAEKCQSI